MEKYINELGPETVWFASFVFSRRKKFVQVWNNLRVIKSWENFYSINYLRWIIPFNVQMKIIGDTHVLIYQTCLFVPFLFLQFYLLYAFLGQWCTFFHHRMTKNMTLRTSFWRICGIQGLAKRQFWSIYMWAVTKWEPAFYTYYYYYYYYYFF